MYPNYILDSKIVLEAQQTLLLPVVQCAKSLERAESFLNKVERKTTCQPDSWIEVGDLSRMVSLEVRAFERYCLSGGGRPDEVAEEAAVMTPTRLSREGCQLPFLRPNEILEKCCQIREYSQEIVRKAHLESTNTWLQNATDA